MCDRREWAYNQSNKQRVRCPPRPEETARAYSLKQRADHQTCPNPLVAVLPEQDR
jgi:hypothetical protein